MRPYTLVASTISSRREYRRIARPTNSSELPCWYVFAVSHRVTPSSTACRKNGCEASSSSVHVCRPLVGSPKLMQPIAIRLTVSPVRPRRVYSMTIPFEFDRSEWAGDAVAARRHRRHVARRPARQQPEVRLRGRPRLGRVDDEGQSGLPGELGHLVLQGHLADDGVVEGFGADAVQTDVVCGPAAPEVAAAGGQLADELLQPAVVRVAGSGGVERRDGVVGDGIPVSIEVLGVGDFEELEAREVRGIRGC